MYNYFDIYIVIHRANQKQIDRRSTYQYIYSSYFIMSKQNGIQSSSPQIFAIDIGLDQIRFNNE